MSTLPAAGLRLLPCRALLSLLLVLAFGACGPVGSDDDDDDRSVPILGGGTHDLDEVVLTEVASGSDGLMMPRDLAFNPQSPEDLYVASYELNGMTIIHDAASEDADALIYNALGSEHFLVQPSGLAFADNGFFATVHEMADFTQGPPPFGSPADFMGPSLWDSDPDIFDGGWPGHMDMLHNSPNAMGVAWEVDNAYWVFDGYHSAITRYDFQEDHGPGGEYHGDGVVARYVEGEVDRRSGVPSHMEYDHDTDLLYIADTGNNRVAVLDTRTGTAAGAITPNYDSPFPEDTGEQYEVEGADITTLVDGEEHNMSRPSGLALHDGLLFISDNKRGTIYAFDMDTGELLDWLELGLDEDALMGITFDADGNLWFANATDDQIVRISLP